MRWHKDNRAIWEKIYTDRPEDVYVHSANFIWEAYLTRSILKNISEIDSVIDVGCGEGLKRGYYLILSRMQK